MTRFDNVLDKVGDLIRRHVASEPDKATLPIQTDVARLLRVLRPGDVILVDGRDKVSAAIRYLTQSSWSHAALYIGDRLGQTSAEGERLDVIEMNLGEGCVAAPLSKYRFSPTRICRPVNVTPEDRDKVAQYMIDRIGLQYDTRNIFDLARFLIPHPPVPARWRRQMLALGSGEPTRAICSTLIAQAFHSIRYPILPTIDRIRSGGGLNGYTEQEIWHIRHHSLFAPRDFDASPYFEVIKPTIIEGFDYKSVTWSIAMQAWQPPTAPVALLTAIGPGTTPGPASARPREASAPLADGPDGPSAASHA